MRRVAPLMLLTLASCVAVEGFDPVGDQSAIRGSWTIDGELPDEARCRALGAERVRVTFLDDRRPVPHSGLFSQCTARAFDTRGASEAVIGAGRWTIRLDAIDGSGNVLAVGTPAEVLVEEAEYHPDGGALVDVPAADFLSGVLSAAYRIEGQEPDQDRCEAAGISTVGFVFDDLGGGRVASTEAEPCSVAYLGTRVLPGFAYTVHVEARDAAGALLAESTPQTTASVTAGQSVELDAAGPIDLRP